MLTLASNDQLYIYSSAEVDYIVFGYTIVDNINTQLRVLFKYTILAGTTRLISEIQNKTIITSISLTGDVADASVKVFVNGTDEVNQVYENIIQPGYNLVLDDGDWIDNKFVPSTEDDTPDTTESDFMALAIAL